MMNEHTGKEMFSQAERFFHNACLPEQVQTLIQDGGWQIPRIVCEGGCGDAGRQQGQGDV
ncbi:MAG: hypothetical protein HC869_07300 [Rhodospirillales bacterium]|nr:hypothetical protein [Rhodospirillales bacterium]